MKKICASHEKEASSALVRRKGQNKLYGVIYADPPWCYENKCPSGNVHEQYETMTDEDICALDIPAANNSVLYIWATTARLPAVFDVIDAWGFRYKSSAVWDKERTGIGYWFLGQHEFLFVATRGQVRPPVPELRISSVIRCRRGGHSRKPDYVRDQIAKWYPTVPKLEMFSRLKTPGWDAFGNQVERDLLSGGDEANAFCPVGSSSATASFSPKEEN